MNTVAGKVIGAAVIGAAMAGVAYLITKRLQADDELWAEPLPGTTKVEKLIVTDQK